MIAPDRVTPDLTTLRELYRNRAGIGRSDVNLHTETLGWLLDQAEALARVRAWAEQETMGHTHERARGCDGWGGRCQAHQVLALLAPPAQ